MNKLHILIFSCIALFVSLFAASQVGAFSIRELLGLDEEKEESVESSESAGEKSQQTPSQNWAKQGGSAGQIHLTLADVQRVLANVDASQRQALLTDEAAFKQFVLQEANNLSVLTAAKVNNVDKDANTVFLMQRSADNVLRETYLNKLIATKTPAGFPTEEQAREYFDKNKEKFVVPERVHVWQVFLQITGDMDEKQIAALQKKAESISADIRKGRVSFADAAGEHSAHEQSKVSGGYMGLIKVTELKPEIGKPLLGLPEDRTSDPIKSDAGFHIVKRGAKVPPLDVQFEQVEGQIKNLLRNQVRKQLRQAIYEQAGKTYPIDLQDTKLEEWRMRMKTKLEQG